MANQVRETVLIVEDDEGICYLQTHSLQRAGYEVVSARTEGEALEQLSAGSVDLIILDYRLQHDRTGLDLHADLKAAGYHQPVIMVTGYGSETTIIKAMQAGVRDYVTKTEEYLDYLPIAVERLLSQARLEKRLVESDKQLRHAQKMEAIGTLAGGIAHEFNNLLQAILGYTRYAMEGLESDDERLHDLQQVVDAGERATALTRQLLGFSRREVLQISDVQPNVLVRSLVKMLRPLIGEHIKIELLLGEDVGTVHADEAHLQQMLMNLCVNARDAMPQGGQLTIKSESLEVSAEYAEYYQDIVPGRYLLLTVADTGCGMPPDVRNHIFEPFFTTKGVGRGTGLGLAMVYGMVQQHQGEIRVYSEENIGTTFRIYLPTVERAVEPQAATAPKAVRGGTETILIAEDDRVVRELAVRMLKRAGYEILTAVDGEDAVRLFAENAERVSLALLDVIMPRLGGHDAFEQMQAINPSLPAILCSGYDSEMVHRDLIGREDLRLIQKPFDPELLLSTIREVLDLKPCLTTT